MSLLATIHLAISATLFVVILIEGRGEDFPLRLITAALVALLWLPLLIAVAVFIALDWIDGKLRDPWA